MNRPTLIILSGPPGSGKTTYAEKYVAEHPNTISVSSDKIRAELWGDEGIQGNNNEVFSLMQSRAVDTLNNGEDVIYDCTSMTRKDRAGIITACPKFAKIECYIIWAPIEVCIERDAARERTVGKAVIDRILKRFQAPYYDEGIDEIKIVLPDAFNQYEYGNSVMRAMKIQHDNPHHTLDVYDHCMKAHKLTVLKTHNYFDEVCFAAQYHDIGKPYVKAFTDSSGNHCETAHYYQHECVGAWMSYGMPNVTPYIAWLISAHMDPYFNTKYYNKLPAYLKKQVDLLHGSDLAAH